MSTSQVTVHTAEIDITQLPTKSVTFAPTRVTVTREIERIQTQLGANEVVISGLDPNIDPDSVRVEGYGQATITDIQAEVVPRKQQFEDQYPEYADQSDDDDSDEQLAALANNDYGIDKTAVENAKRELQSAEAALASFENSQRTALKVVEFLDIYGQSLKAQEVAVDKMADFLNVYRTQRATEGETHHKASTEISDWTKKVSKARDNLTRAESAFKKATDAASREARREQEKRARKKSQDRLQKQRIIQQRRMFWTAQVTQVIVHLDRASAYTPSSSRRQSLVSGSDNGADCAPAKSLDEDSVNLSLTYVVPNAKWAPRYELKINTPKSSAELVYRAEFENNTSETWKNAKVTFSTSQTFFSGLDDKIPVLDPWHLQLSATPFGLVRNGISTSSIQSQKEVLANTTSSVKSKRKTKAAGSNGAPLALAAPVAAGRSLSTTAARASALFGSVSMQQQAAPPPPMRRLPPSEGFNGPAGFHEEDCESEEEDDDLTLNLEAHSISHQDSIRQDYGLTTTYDLPGQRTLEPSSVKRRHVIAELRLTSITLSHVLIPKLRCAAFLKARITNTTAVSLLRGKVGMTVDGAFLGSTMLPSCEPGHFIDLSLGVDPSILVTYAKPTARRSTTGFFSKEDSAIYSRSCWIKNTKKHDVSITVLDQVPISEDEQLRINILEPRGLDMENDRQMLSELFKNGEKGTGEVVLEKYGQIKWNLKLRPGKEVKLVLEYESRVPSGQHIRGLD